MPDFNAYRALRATDDGSARTEPAASDCVARA
jgi:hypothetical protein